MTGQFKLVMDVELELLHRLTKWILLRRPYCTGGNYCTAHLEHTAASSGNRNHAPSLSKGRGAQEKGGELSAAACQQ
jgi:hypothetical protein